MRAVAQTLPPRALEESLGKALETLDALIAELGGRPADAPFAWLPEGGAAWLRPLVELARELEAIRLEPARAGRGADVTRALMRLVEGRTPVGDFTRRYIAARETQPRAITRHVLVLSTCIHLEWLFERGRERPSGNS